MKRRWTVEELIEQWSLSSDDRDLLYRKESTGRLGLVAQLAFYRRYARFPERRGEFAPAVIAHLAEQIDATPSTLDAYEWSDRTGRRHRERILEFLGVGPFDLVAEMELRSWLMTDAFPQEPNADALEEWLLRRFTRSNTQHLTYRALAELGKAAKTLFLCDYLDSMALRREIHEGLNVIENWNGANSFIWFGKGGEVASNRLEEQEVSLLALHLLQSCLVYINTLMLQRVLEEVPWSRRMTEVDMRGLTPLVYGHVSPYGSFELKMHERIDIELNSAA
jgi:hypothetical protein